MKKYFFLIVFTAFLFFELDAKVTVYGRNTGTTIVTEVVEHPDGRKVTTTTTTISCDNWYPEVCYESEATIVLPNGNHRLTDGDSNVIMEGVLISSDYSSNVFVFESIEY